MRRKVLRFFLLLLGSLVIAAAVWGYEIFLAPVTPVQESYFKIRRGWKLTQVADSLAAHGLLADRQSFITAARLIGRAEKLKAGKYLIAPRSSNLDLIKLFESGRALRQRVTIPEGLGAAGIAGLMQRELEIDSSAFMALVKDERLAGEMGIDAPCLEGYLYPNTYQFYWGDTARDVINVLVGEFHLRLPDSLIDRAKEIGWRLHDVVTLASIIEGEAAVDSERALISAVYWNRLRKGMRLQADPTIQYIIPGPPRRVLHRDLAIDSPYNTYLHAGLPPGPVNNPGSKSIVAALYPKPAGYLYFVARGDGSHVFSYTLSQHNAAKRQFDRYRASVRAAGDSRAAPGAAAPRGVRPAKDIQP